MPSFRMGVCLISLVAASVMSAGCRGTHFDTPVVEKPIPSVPLKQRPTPVPLVKSDLHSKFMAVQVDSINIRSAPDDNAPVVGRLTKGSVFHVTVERGWARVGEAKYVSAKYLVNTKIDGREPLRPRHSASNR